MAGEGLADKGLGGRDWMPKKGAEQVREGVRRLEVEEDLEGGLGGRELLSTSCMGLPQTPWWTSMVPQAMRLTTIHQSAFKVCTFFSRLVSLTRPATDRVLPLTISLSTRAAAQSLATQTMLIAVERDVRESLFKRWVSKR